MRPIFVFVLQLISAAVLSTAAIVTHAQSLAPPLPETYRFTVFGTPDGFYGGAPAAINNRGDVVVNDFGIGPTGIGPTHVGLWQGQIRRDLGAGSAYGINDQTVVVGQKDGLATAWVSGRPTSLSDFICCSVGSAQAINGVNQIVGFYTLPSPDFGQHAAFWPSISGPPMDLGGSGTYAAAINNAGQVAGEWNAHAVVWTNGVRRDLSLPGEVFSSATGINDEGIVIGASDDRPVVWSGASFEMLSDLGFEQSGALDINNYGQIVGYVGFGIPHVGRFDSAVIWQGTSAVDLNTRLRPSTIEAGWHLDRATAINDQGWIVGTASLPGGGPQYSFLLSISNEPDQFLQPTAIPEPATYSLVLGGLILLGLHRVRHRAEPALFV